MSPSGYVINDAALLLHLFMHLLVSKGIQALAQHITCMFPSQCLCALPGQGSLLLSKSLGWEWEVVLVKCHPLLCVSHQNIVPLQCLQLENK